MIACPRCNSEDTCVVDSRGDGGGYVRRRRSCKQCGARLTTVEMVVTERPGGGKTYAGNAVRAASVAGLAIQELHDIRERLDAVLSLVREAASPPLRRDGEILHALPEGLP